MAVMVGAASLPVEKAADVARILGMGSALVVSLHIFVIRQLYDLRDPDELSASERADLRSIINRRTNSIWAWVIVIVALGSLGAVAPWLTDGLGNGFTRIAWMGACWTLYSLLLIPRWSAEIATFKSLIADRKRDREARDAALKEMGARDGEDWKHLEDIDAYIRMPEDADKSGNSGRLPTT